MPANSCGQLSPGPQRSRYHVLVKLLSIGRVGILFWCVPFEYPSVDDGGKGTAQPFQIVIAV